MKLFNVKQLFHLLLPSILLLPTAGHATIAQAPLFVNTAIQPNILFLVDDSGSMGWAILKSTGALADAEYSDNSDFPSDGINDDGTVDMTPSEFSRAEILEACVGYNVVYYDPTETYTPWPGVDINGDAYVDQSISAARANPYDPDDGHGVVDLVDFYDGSPGYFTWTDSNNDGEFQRGECPDPDDAGFDYDADFTSTDEMTAAEQTNFANWASYYRTREHVTKAALLSIFDSSTARLGLATLHNNNTVAFPILDVTSGTNRSDLMDKVGLINSSGGTPLRQKLEEAGEYYEGTTDTALFGTEESSPILSSADGGSCQQNFTVLMSDGYWNGDNPSVGDADTDNNTDYDGGVYADGSPIAGSGSLIDDWPTFHERTEETLADVAMHYYERDLDSSLDNEVPTSIFDSNNQQHMVTYTVAFGVNGTLDDTPPTVSGAKNWPSVEGNTSTTIDDMRHAAFNGRGEFLSAASPSTLIQTFNNAVASIAGRISSASSVATNSTRLDTNSKIYQARFTSEAWSGDLLAFSLNAFTGAVDSLAWNAASRVPAENSRNIFTYNEDNAAGSRGVAFEHANLSTAHQALLTTGQVNYLRGDQSDEGTLYRSRTAVLGDIVNSDPLFSGRDDFNYYVLELDGSGFATYDNYLSGTTEDWQKGNRTDMLYVGANDGMLHGLLGDGNTANTCSLGSKACEGEEVLAYVPKAVYSNLADLTSTGYSHQFYVDNSPVQGDAYIDWGGSQGEGWGTALVGTLGAGGKGIFALNISDPLNFSGEHVLWDLDDGDLSDLGYTFSKPTVAKMENGEWAVIFGNGYHSANHEPVLYILSLEDGSEIITPLKAGTAYRGTAASTNGLSTPIVIDTDGNRKADTIYAGDLQGNMWKFDVSSSNDGQWDFAYKDGNGANADPLPLFTACAANTCTTTNRQPITSKPQVVSGTSEGVIVLFGTGKYFETGDNIDTSTTQSFYGINDTGSVVDERADLQAQLIVDEQPIAETGFTHDIRVTSANDVDYTTQKGWYLDFYYDETPLDSAHDHPGERVVADPLVRNGRVIFPTLIPETDPCSFGGTGYLMELDAQTGSRLEISPFDNDGDGNINDNDFVHIDTDGDGVKDTWVPVSGKKSGVGIIKTPGVISTGDNELKYTSGSSGDIEVTVESAGDKLGRQSWIQVK
ncbi:pilus assembly protein [Neptuniibacter sp. QD34_54]|uniref:pilus assembly protein n=1 Tax=Neptuniibacter sp. QD34_54 TaxID=3398208 RepID=UPI0039F49F57